MNNRNPSTTNKTVNRKKKEKTKNTHDPKNVNEVKNLGEESQDMVNAAASKSVEQNLNSLINITKQENSDLHAKKTCNESSKSEDWKNNSTGSEISKDEVDKALEIKYETKVNVTNHYQDNLTRKKHSPKSDKHNSPQTSYKIKQELLLAALEKPCTKKKDSGTELSNMIDPAKTELNSKCQELELIIGGATSENTARTEKELRRLEWQNKHMEQNLKKENEESLSKAELKAQRREQQEAQRLTKVVNKEQCAQKSLKSTSKASVGKETSPIKESQKAKSTDEKSLELNLRLKDKNLHSSPKPPIKPVFTTFPLQNVTSHLSKPATNTIVNDDRIVNFNDIHPEFIRLGVKVSSKIVIGSNARCLAMLSAIRHLVVDIQAPPKQDFCRYLESVLQKSIDHLNSCRPLSVCMKNALKYFKSEVINLSLSASEQEKKKYLIEVIDTYIKEDIEVAAEGIAMEASSKITNGDVVLTFGCSSLVEKVLLKAKEANKDFEVIVVDSCMLEGREMLRRLVVEGVQCKYVQLHALSHVMACASLVFLGAHALLSNGYIMSRIGTAKVAMAAKIFNKPVIVCSEAYKLSDLVQSDAFVHNELGDPNELIDKDRPLASLKAHNKIFLLNLLYDFTPPDFVRAVITELGSFNGKSVPSLRRKKPKTLL